MPVSYFLNCMFPNKKENIKGDWIQSLEVPSSPHSSVVLWLNLLLYSRTWCLHPGTVCFIISQFLLNLSSSLFPLFPRVMIAIKLLMYFMTLLMSGNLTFQMPQFLLFLEEGDHLKFLHPRLIQIRSYFA